MNDNFPDDPQLVRLIDQLCDEFEAAQEAGSEPPLDAFLERVPESARPYLLKHLLEMTAEEGQSATPEETTESLTRRYPQYKQLFQSHFRRTAGAHESRRTDEQPAAVGKTSVLGGLLLAALGNKPPRQIGPYALLQRLGEGGMGSVWLGRQTDPIERDAAIKIIRPDLTNARFIQRFETERRALARLDHPNIPRVFDAGAEDGIPYLIMEHVRGVPLTQYCREKNLGIRPRLKLLSSICRAVMHAHQHGVIHRDLKPDNILVTEVDGEPFAKVIDFGLALTESDEQGAGGDGTLQYMAPEQARAEGEDVDGRVDVYSLGVIMFELLTGRPPLDSDTAGGMSRAECLEFITRHRVQSPSRVLSIDREAWNQFHAESGVSFRKLQRILRDELDWVIERALELSPADRYPTPGDLADDIERFLDDRDTKVRKPSLYQRARRSLRRHRLGYSVGGLVIATFLTGLYFGFLGVAPPTTEELLFDETVAADAEVRALNLLEYLDEVRSGKRTLRDAPINDSDSRGKINLFRSLLSGVVIGYEENLTHTCFVQADLTEVGMSNCYFGGSVFSDADLTGATMNGSDFTNAIFTNAVCRNGNFHCAGFISARMTGCDFSNARLECCCLAGIQSWKNAVLAGANLNQAVVDRADWIEHVGAELRSATDLDEWEVQRIPDKNALTDERYKEYDYWLVRLSATESR